MRPWHQRIMHNLRVHVLLQWQMEPRHQIEKDGLTINSKIFASLKISGLKVPQN
jgi:hypothetical protein